MPNQTPKIRSHIIHPNIYTAIQGFVSLSAFFVLHLQNISPSFQNACLTLVMISTVSPLAIVLHTRFDKQFAQAIEPLVQAVRYLRSLTLPSLCAFALTNCFWIPAVDEQTALFAGLCAVLAAFFLYQLGTVLRLRRSLQSLAT